MPDLDDPRLPAANTVLAYADPAVIARHQHQPAAGDVRVYPSRTTQLSANGTQGDPLGAAGDYMTVTPGHAGGE
jgi:hypothetical protein